MLIGVAGHVDHGKTALVRALTGTDADRLPEERRRGMTIDLGFAYGPAGDDGRILGFVDLPGHERYLHNFMAGALTLDQALLVIAADEGPRPQTLEHLAILDRIGLERLVVALSKRDRVDADRLAMAQTEVRAMLAATGFAEAEILATSSVTGAGVEALRERLEALPPRPPSAAAFRMAIDRVFQLAGAGLVATGAVAAGAVAVGETLVVTPAGAPVRVRSLHAQNRNVARAGAGERCGLALAGLGDRRAARRGAWLVDPRLHAPTQTLLALVRDLPGQGLRHGRQARLHLAAEALDARIIQLGEPSTQTAYPVLLGLDRPVAALRGDRLALRDPAAQATLAAGRVLDPFPPDRRRLRAVPPATQAALGAEDPAAALAARLAVDGAVDLARFALSRNLDPAAVRTFAGAEAIGSVLLAPERAEALRRQARERLAEAHRREPDRLGLDMRELARSLCNDDWAVAAAVVEDMVAQGALRRRGGLVHLPGHAPRPSDEDEALWQELEPRLAATPERPPTLAELAAALETDWRALRSALGRLAHFGRVDLATPNRAFLPEAITSLELKLGRLAEQAPGGLFTVADFNAAASLGRNLSVEILECFDRRGITLRLGDRRRLMLPLRGSSAER
jgi:selenocysteine-specific elongation factor